MERNGSGREMQERWKDGGKKGSGGCFNKLKKEL